MFIPTSTYRVQFHKDFTFSDLASILDYLQDLGVTTVYAAPILKARPGSMHGYDVVDPGVINPEIGTESEFRQLIGKLKERNMSWIQDIVPNHMAFHTDNVLLMDVLERGQDSPYRNYFDIEWNHHDPKLRGKVQVPFLGKPLNTCINDGEIKIDFSLAGVVVKYFDTEYPLSISAYPVLKKYVPEIDIRGIVAAKGSPGVDWRKAKTKFIDDIAGNDLHLQCVLERLFKINRQPEIISEILGNQYYVLDYWKETEKIINYRRFFTVNELICLRMEDDQVFDDYHAYLHQLYKEGLIQGVRIDHIDGLHDPLRYLRRLRQLFGADCYIIAEKILESKETLPDKWPIEGTSGYEFLSFVSQLVTNRKGARQLLSFYRDLVPDQLPYQELVRQNKWLILESYMQGEWNNLVELFCNTIDIGTYERARMKKALGWVMVSLPVYRIYPDAFPLRATEREVLHESFEKALQHGAEFRDEINFIQTQLTDGESADFEKVLYFLKRLMQFTGPLTAKGVEDTTFYVYNALISHDEVGDAPSALGISIADFHRKMVQRQIATPLSLNTTATHDTKRGEDARMRLNTLCDFPDQWQDVVNDWMQRNQTFKRKLTDGTLAPTVNDEYYLYQSIVGGFPENLQVDGSFVDRLIAYQTKVVREAKVNSNWSDPNTEYEDACHAFIRSILTPGSYFLQTLIPFLSEINPLAHRYSLAQALIKITSPGIPDTYQGGALWDLSFVDPDNRRPVDYVKRYEFLSQLRERSASREDGLFSYLEDHRQEGIEKLFVTWRALEFRKTHPELFTEGEYLPLQVSGDDVVTVAYARVHRNKWLMILIPLRVKARVDQTDLNVNDTVILPDTAPSAWKNILTGEELRSERRLSLAKCFNRFPIAVLQGEL